MNKQHSATSMITIQHKHMSARLVSSFLRDYVSMRTYHETPSARQAYRTNPSLIRCTLMNVYSLYPANASTGSSRY